jgi:hypothetical protein
MSGRLRRLGADGRLALMLSLTLLAILAIGLLPTILQEGTRDWIAYQQAADRLVRGDPLYTFVLATPDDEYYLYPPLMAAVWAAIGSPEGLFLVKLIALSGVGALAWQVLPTGAQRERAVVAVSFAAAAFIAPPDLHDLVLGNVMAFYVGAVAVSLAASGWLGALPLGLVCALALKPAIGPFLLWLLIRRRGDFGRVLVVGLAASIACALFIGPGRYVEYIVALPQMSVLSDLPSGNVGLSHLSRALGLVGVAAAYLLTVAGALGADRWRSAAIAIAAGLLAQPALGFNYAGLLLPAVVSLWLGDRPAGLIACVAVPIVAVLSPPLAALIVILLAFRTLPRSIRFHPLRAEGNTG